MGEVVACTALGLGERLKFPPAGTLLGSCGEVAGCWTVVFIPLSSRDEVVDMVGD